MTIATSDQPLRTTDMGRKEAEQITQAIKDNFDSLGAMLAQARDRKAYKALGYRSFETYCQSEFGKSISSAYQLIEDAKVISQLEAKISEEYGENVTLKFPSSHLKPLKEIDNIDDKLKAIEYANKLAAAENRKATKKDLEIAVFQVSGKRSEDFKAAIQGLGFSKGVQVEVFKALNKDRGFVTKIDKGGKIHVEFHYGGNAAIPYDAADLRILSEDEQPAQPLNEDVANKGDRVLIFSPALKGKEGTIFQWKSGKQALVMVDEKNSPIDIAYAEMELLKLEQKDTNWEADLSWNTVEQTYFYFQREDRIYSDQWPAGLALTPFSHELSPIDFMKVWEDKFAGQLLEGLATPANIKTLVLAQAIKLSDNEGKEFVADLIANLNQLFPQVSKPPKAMGISFSQTIDELTSGKKTQTRRAWQDDYAKNFIRYFDENITIPALDKGRHRGGHEQGFIKLTQRPYQQYLSEMSATDLQEEGGMVATTQEFIDTFFEGQDKLVWVLHFEFLSTPTNKYSEEAIAGNQRLREQLTEAEAVIQSMIAASTPATLEAANNPETSTPGEAAPGNDFSLETDSWREILKANDFIPVSYELDGYFKGSWRGWKMFFHAPNGGVTAIDIANEKEEMFTRCTEIDFDIDLGDEEAIINWTRGIINQIEDFCPGQLSLFPNTPETDSTASTIEPQTEEGYFPVELAAKISEIEAKFQADINKIEHQLKTGIPARESEKNLLSKLNRLKGSLKNLEDVQKLRIGQSMRHKAHPEDIGKITWFTLTPGGIPTVLVQWISEMTGEKSYIYENVEMLSPADKVD